MSAVDGEETAQESRAVESEEAPLDGNLGESAICARLRSALREARRRVQRLEAENQALQEELLNAGEMIESLAEDLEKAVRE